MKLHRFPILALLLLVLSLASSCIKNGAKEDERREGSTTFNGTVYGRVTSGGAGVPGVVVSDGHEIVVTDSEGKYDLNSTKDNGYVFISVPSGYQAVTNGVTPQFFGRCSKKAGEGEQIDFKLEKVDQSRYSLLLFGDIHLADRSFCRDFEQFRTFTDEINGYVASSSVPVYALTLGDMTWDVFWEANGFGIPEYLDMLGREMKNLQVWHTMGNHDNDPSAEGDFQGEAFFRRYIGPNYYSFNIGDIHYVVLDDMVYVNASGNRDFLAQVSEEQLEWLRKDLAYVSKSTPVVVAMHTPLYRRDGSSALRNLGDFIRCFEGYDYVQLFTAHTHNVYDVDMLKRSIHIHECNSGAVCGAWWMTSTACESGLNLCSDGAPAGYRIVDVSGKKISWRYKGTSCPDNFVFRTYDRNRICLSADKWTPHASKSSREEFEESAGSYAKPSSANQVLINVWDYDPSWKISVTENGKSLKVTRLTDARDPLYLAVYDAYEYEHGYTLSYPCGKTDHLFSVTASSSTSTLVVSVTDRFGRTCSETMSRPKEFLSPKLAR